MSFLGGCYDTAKRKELHLIYQDFCKHKKLEFTFNNSIISPDNTTLFTTSGMQKHKQKFQNQSLKNYTISDIQHCLRLNDLDELGDGTHFLDFYMLGLFSFRDWTLKNAVDFWFDFLNVINIKPDYVTIHPDKQEHRDLYIGKNIEIKIDKDCYWSDGDIGGYCTEFYKNGIEIGNIVNPLNTCIDCGFGMERLLMIHQKQNISSKDILNQTISILLNENILPSSQKQGYVIRKIIRKMIKENLQIIVDDKFINIIENEKMKVEKIKKEIPKLLKKYPNKDKLFFKETFGINLDEI